jgi:hypothetical protein
MKATVRSKNQKNGSQGNPFRITSGKNQVFHKPSFWKKRMMGIWENLFENN